MFYIKTRLHGGLSAPAAAAVASGRVKIFKIEQSAKRRLFIRSGKTTRLTTQSCFVINSSRTSYTGVPVKPNPRIILPGGEGVQYSQDKLTPSKVFLGNSYTLVNQLIWIKIKISLDDFTPCYGIFSFGVKSSKKIIAPPGFNTITKEEV